MNMQLLEEQGQLSFMRKLAGLLSFLLYNLSITGSSGLSLWKGPFSPKTLNELENIVAI
jgi:hypothetical protein